jgi:alcohol dehydrogenase
MPRDQDFTVAPAVPLAALTAPQALKDELNIEPGQKVQRPPPTSMDGNGA